MKKEFTFKPIKNTNPDLKRFKFQVVDSDDIRHCMFETDQEAEAQANLLNYANALGYAEGYQAGLGRAKKLTSKRL